MKHTKTLNGVPGGQAEGVLRLVGVAQEVITGHRLAVGRREGEMRPQRIRRARPLDDRAEDAGLADAGKCDKPPPTCVDVPVSIEQVCLG